MIKLDVQPYVIKAYKDGYICVRYERRKNNMAELKDSGARRDFGTGAVRDAADGKGRCDLLPLDVVGFIFDNDNILTLISQYIQTGNTDDLKAAIRMFGCSHNEWYSTHTAILEVSKQYEDGCKKYGDRNWEKGIPLHCYIDSGVRHYLKYLRGDTDEPHDRAFVWNMLGAIWTQWNKPEMIDLPFINKTSKPKEKNDYLDVAVYGANVPIDNGSAANPVDDSSYSANVQVDEVSRTEDKHVGCESCNWHNTNNCPGSSFCCETIFYPFYLPKEAEIDEKIIDGAASSLTEVVIDKIVELKNKVPEGWVPVSEAAPCEVKQMGSGFTCDIEIKNMIQCPKCAGTGVIVTRNTGNRYCEKCEGTGKIKSPTNYESPWKEPEI